jgi:hypothetical protein
VKINRDRKRCSDYFRLVFVSAKRHRLNFNSRCREERDSGVGGQLVAATADAVQRTGRADSFTGARCDQTLGAIRCLTRMRPRRGGPRLLRCDKPGTLQKLLHKPRYRPASMDCKLAEGMVIFFEAMTGTRKILVKNALLSNSAEEYRRYLIRVMRTECNDISLMTRYASAQANKRRRAWFVKRVASCEQVLLPSSLCINTWINLTTIAQMTDIETMNLLRQVPLLRSGMKMRFASRRQRMAASAGECSSRRGKLYSLSLEMSVWKKHAEQDIVVARSRPGRFSAKSRLLPRTPYTVGSCRARLPANRFRRKRFGICCGSTRPFQVNFPSDGDASSQHRGSARRGGWALGTMSAGPR